MRYSQVDDVGQPINPLIVHGQTHGGIAQGLGEALWEGLSFDPDTGCPVNGSFVSYALPRASGIPPMVVELVEDPTSSNPLRIKGAGEGGVTPALAAAGGALVDALRDYSVEHVPMPATAPVLWALMQRRPPS
jgi:carbon-monoxide dehydrogenase large subunit